MCIGFGFVVGVMLAIFVIVKVIDFIEWLLFKIQRKKNEDPKKE